MGLADVLQSIQKKLSFSKAVEISGIKFELRLLSFEQELKTEAMPSDDMDPLTYYNQTRLQTLSYAVKSINGEEIPAVVETGDKPEKIQGNLYVKQIMSSMPIKIVEQLFEVYIDLKDEAEGKLDQEMKYNWFKTPEQRTAESKNKKAEEAKAAQSASSEAEEDIKLREIPVPPKEEDEEKE